MVTVHAAVRYLQRVRKAPCPMIKYPKELDEVCHKLGYISTDELYAEIASNKTLEAAWRLGCPKVKIDGHRYMFEDYWLTTII